MKTRTRAGIALAVGAGLALGPALAASGAASTISNGSFEADAVGSTTITGWASLNQAIDLGVTAIAGCTTVDTSDYDYLTLRDYGVSNDDPWDRYGEEVPEFEGAYYVIDDDLEEYVLILGDRLVYQEDEEQLYLEQIPDPVSEPTSAAEPEFGLSSVAADPGAPAEPAPSESAPAEPEPEPSESAPTEPAPAETSPAEPAPSETAPGETAPVEPSDVATEPLAPASVSATYIARSAWSPEQLAAFRSALAATFPNPITRGDDLANAELTEEEYSTTIVDQAFIDDRGDDIELGRDGSVLELFSDLEGDLAGYVTHGPAVVSDPFTVGAGRQISLDWKAVDESDDFHVFGYLLNVDTCAQTEVIDATGLLQDWTTTSVAIPVAGTYRFVFVSGSYDQSWGGAAGAYMYIDNIVQTPVFSSPGVDLALAAGIGEYLPGSDVQVSGGGLLPASEYDLVLRSTPVLVTEGVTDGDGRFLDVVSLPMDITPGAHTITLTGQGPGGPLTQVAYITVGADGTLLYFSTVGPQALLASTGAEENAGILALALLLALAGIGAIELDRRRRAPFGTVYVR